ncbi:heterokaryon incompatibility protein-domain-containing protein [Ilyonectria robusta]|uniref:heterokaryon incompatibility protein-domain-containing protein n=1 Tax=Ilyonectria robusta TaxID=1079257 RepID=UPI001E8E8980|nr:heterokaryon incompatibility protein-domain-containing protein [Ilyonectria robusta]KAH8665315.1 heterokaryon incompatibility protein-domain-containing protein [Ilyonectria robusta]
MKRLVKRSSAWLSSRKSRIAEARHSMSQPPEPAPPSVADDPQETGSTEIHLDLSIRPPGPQGYVCWDASQCKLCSCLRDPKIILDLFLHRFAILGTTRDLLVWSQENERCMLCIYIILQLIDELGGPEYFVTDANFIIRWSFGQESGLAHSQIHYFEFEMSWGFPQMRTRQVHMNAFTVDGQAAADCVAFRPPNPVVAGPAAMATARGWIETCERDHADCRAKGPTPLPTRVLEISGVGADDIAIRLHETGGEGGRYVALSYVWGDPTKQYTTIQSNLAAHKNGIIFEDLPHVVGEAAVCAQQLGIKYLWVDALCIVQDSSEDKAREIAAMAQVYKNAWVTVVAAKSTGASESFTEPRPDIQGLPGTCFNMGMIVPKDVKGLLAWIDGHRKNPEYRESLDYRDQVKMLFETTPWFADEDAWEDDLSTVWLAGKAAARDKRDLIDAPSIDAEPISKRGWTLQESWLSRRMLIYGSGQTLWQCGEGNKADGGQAPYQYQTFKRHHFSPPLDSVNTERFSSIWRDLVQDFSKRQLGDPADKLNALQGIVHELEEETGDEYFGGIWKGNPIAGLSWYQNATNKDPDLMVFTPARTCPSWSWAKVDGPLSFSVAENVTASVEDIKITKNEITGHYPASTHLVVEGEVSIKARVSTLDTSEILGQFRWLSPTSTAQPFSNLLYIDGCLTNPDFKISYEDGQPTILCDGDYKFLELSRGKWDGRQNIAAESRGLMVVAVEGRPNTFRRVGFFIVALEYDVDSIAGQDNVILCLSVEEGNVKPTEFGEMWTASLEEETLTLV